MRSEEYYPWKVRRVNEPPLRCQLCGNMIIKDEVFRAAPWGYEHFNCTNPKENPPFK